MQKFTDLKLKKIKATSKLISDNYPHKINNLLVVGCGSGIEAAILARELRAEVIGIDLKNNFDPDAAHYATLKKGDAMSLDFKNEIFDFVYSYHALEHIRHYWKLISVFLYFSGLGNRDLSFQ